MRTRPSAPGLLTSLTLSAASRRRRSEITTARACSCSNLSRAALRRCSVTNLSSSITPSWLAFLCSCCSCSQFMHEGPGWGGQGGRRKCCPGDHGAQAVTANACVEVISVETGNSSTWLKVASTRRAKSAQNMQLPLPRQVSLSVVGVDMAWK